MACDVEDIIDNFMYYKNRLQNSDPDRVSLIDRGRVLMLWASDQIALRGTNRTSNSDQASFSFGAGSHVHQLLPLEMDEAWALFWMEASSSNKGCCPQNLDY
ncbi:hypothetical protein H0E87_025273 [Populus deltoides]|uniref:Uncharacterized protein n=1 Tax=Populus deltoides TaxID=3696 RepID=A0A8T2X1C8_POPDE|nr:hypothetical protein H0E87_025273 [Populus deltoides]